MYHSHTATIYAGLNGNDGKDEIQQGQISSQNPGWKEGFVSIGGSQEYTNGASARHTHDYSHSHTFTHYHGMTENGGDENRPSNYTVKIWKRVS